MAGTLGVGLVVVVILGDLLEMEALVPAVFLTIVRGYLLLELVDDAHLVPRLAAADLGDGVLRLPGVVVVVAPHQVSALLVSETII